MRTRTLIIYLIVIGCLAVAALAWAYWWYGFAPGQSAAPAHTSGQQAYSTLMSSNSSFQQGVDAYQNGNPTEAIADFNLALNATDNPATRATVELSLAPALADTGEYEQAVSIYKSIAADDTDYSASFRANAIQSLGLMYYQYLDPRITAAIFANPPYQSLYTDGKVGLSYRKLFEYAASIYPLAISELRAANWYANQLLSPSGALKADTATQGQYKQTIKSDISAADTEIAAMAKGLSQLPAYFNALLLRANLVGKMTQLGDTSYGNPELGFKQLISLYATDGISSQDGIARIYYAGYLAQTSASTRVSDIQTLLAPVTAATSTPGSMSRFLSVNRQSTGGIKAILVSIASIDPDFKKLLVAQGWTAADFK